VNPVSRLILGGDDDERQLSRHYPLQHLDVVAPGSRLL
jgi:hypothetical protein